MHLLPCVYHEIFGICCPFCGFQRASIALMQGDLSTSVALYPALMPLMFTALTMTALKLSGRRVFGGITKGMLIADLAIMLVACLLKNLGVLPE